MGRVRGCESCGSMDSKHAADIYDVPDVLMCWECETGALFEQERIIKLLKDNRLICVNDRDCYQSIDGGCDCKNFIALIKGSQKDNETVVLLTEGEK